MPDIKIAVNEAQKIAKDNKHGYSQKNRTGNPDYDCSSLVIHCLDKAGFPMSKNGASYTGNGCAKERYLYTTLTVSTKTIYYLCLLNTTSLHFVHLPLCSEC